MILRPRDVGLTLFRIVLRQRVCRYCGGRTGLSEHLFCQLSHGELIGIADIYRPRNRRFAFHQSDKAVDQIIHIAERPALAAITVQGNWLRSKRLYNEIGNYPSVGLVHPGAVGIENPGNLDLEPVLTVIVEK